MSESEFLTIGEIVKASLSRTKKYVDAVLQAKKISWSDVTEKPDGVVIYKGQVVNDNAIDITEEGSLYLNPSNGCFTLVENGGTLVTFPSTSVLANYLLKNDLKWSSIPDIPTDLVYEEDLTWDNLAGKPTNLATTDQLTWESIQDKPTEFPPSDVAWSKITGKPTDIVTYKGSISNVNQIPSNAEPGWLYYNPNDYVFKLIVGKLNDQILTLTIPSNDAMVQTYLKKIDFTWDKLGGKPTNLATTDQFTWENLAGKPTNLATTDELTWENLGNIPINLVYYNGTVNAVTEATDRSNGSLYYIKETLCFRIYNGSGGYIDFPTDVAVFQKYLRKTDFIWDKLSGKPTNLVTTEQLTWDNIQNKPAIDGSGGASDVSWGDIKNKPDLIHYNGTISTSSSMKDYTLGSMYYVSNIKSFTIITSANSDYYTITTIPSSAAIENEYLKKVNLTWDNVTGKPTNLATTDQFTWENLSGKPTDLVTTDSLTWENLSGKPERFINFLGNGSVLAPYTVPITGYTTTLGDTTYTISPQRSQTVGDETRELWLIFSNNYDENLTFDFSLDSQEENYADFSFGTRHFWSTGVFVNGKSNAPFTLTVLMKVTDENKSLTGTTLAVGSWLELRTWTSEELGLSNGKFGAELQFDPPEYAATQFTRFPAQDWRFRFNKVENGESGGVVSVQSACLEKTAIYSKDYDYDPVVNDMFYDSNEGFLLVYAPIRIYKFDSSVINWENVANKPENLATTDDISWEGLRGKPSGLMKFVGNVNPYIQSTTGMTGYTKTFENGNIYEVSPQRTDETTGKALWELFSQTHNYPETGTIVFPLNNSEKNYVNFSFGNELVPVTGLIVDATVTSSFIMYLYVQVTDKNKQYFPSNMNAEIGSWQVLQTWNVTSERYAEFGDDIPAFRLGTTPNDFVNYDSGFVNLFYGNAWRVRFESTVANTTVSVNSIEFLRPKFMEYPNPPTNYTPALNDVFLNTDNEAFYVVENPLAITGIGQFPVEWENVKNFPKLFASYGTYNTVEDLPTGDDISDAYKGCALIAYVEESKAFLYREPTATEWKPFTGPLVKHPLEWTGSYGGENAKLGDVFVEQDPISKNEHVFLLGPEGTKYDLTSMTREDLLASDFLQAVQSMEEYATGWSTIPDEATSTIGAVNKSLFNLFDDWSYAWDAPAPEDSQQYNQIVAFYKEPTTIKGFVIYSNGVPMSDLPSKQLTFYYSNDGETWSIIPDGTVTKETDIIHTFTEPITARYFKFSNMKSNRTDDKSILIPKIAFIMKHAFRPCDVYFDFENKAGYFYTGANWVQLYGGSTAEQPVEDEGRSPILFNGVVNNSNVVDGSENANRIVSLTATVNSDSIQNIVDGSTTTSWTSGDAPESSARISFTFDMTFPTFDAIRIKTPSNEPITGVDVYAAISSALYNDMNKRSVTVKYDAYLGITDIIFDVPFITKNSSMRLDLRNLTSAKENANSVTINEIYFRPSISVVPQDGDLRINELPFTNSPSTAYGEFYYSSKWKRFGNVSYGGDATGKGTIAYDHTEKEFSFGISDDSQKTFPTTELVMSKIETALAPLQTDKIWSPHCTQQYPTSPSEPWEVSGTENDSTNHPAWKAFDGDETTYWEGPAGGTANILFRNAMNSRVPLKDIVGVRFIIPDDQADYFPFGRIDFNISTTGEPWSIEKSYTNIKNPGVGYLDFYIGELYGGNLSTWNFKNLTASDSTKPVRLTEVYFLRKGGGPTISVDEINARIDQKIQDAIGNAIAGSY